MFLPSMTFRSLPFENPFKEPFYQGQKKTMTATDVTEFDANFSTGFSLLSPDFRGSSCQIAHKMLEKKQKNPVESASSGDGAPKLQISVPCRGRTCPDSKNTPPPLLLNFTTGPLLRTLLRTFYKASRPDPCSVDFCRETLVDFFLLFFPRKKARKNPPKNPPQNSPGTLFGKIPLGFLQKPFLDKALLRIFKWQKSKVHSFWGVIAFL